MELLRPAVLLSCTILIISAPSDAASFPLRQEALPAPPQSSTEPRHPLAAQPETVPPEPTITVPAGTRLQLELADPVLTRTAHAGDPFEQRQLLR